MELLPAVLRRAGLVLSPFLLCSQLVMPARGAIVHSAATPLAVPRFEPASCPFDDLEQTLAGIDIAANYHVQCGYVIVPEDHGNPAGPTIKLAVAVYSAGSANAASSHPTPGAGALSTVTGEGLPTVTDHFTATLPLTPTTTASPGAGVSPAPSATVGTGTATSTATTLITNTASPTMTVPLTPTVAKADPLVFLQGGPGEILLGAFGPSRDKLSTAIVQKRPLILFDQRGVGYSRPSLSCQLNLSADYPFAPDQLTTLGHVTQMLQQVRQCHDRLAAQGIDLNDFTTAQSAADVNDIRQALGYRMVSLFGVSYGTRLALETMREFPTTIRSVVLDSVVPPGSNPTYSDITPNFASALNAFLARCHANKACAAADPHLGATLYRAADQLDAHPSSSKHVSVDGTLFMDFVRALLTSTSSVSLLPALIDNTAAGDYSLLSMIADGVNATSKNALSPISAGAYLSILCGEGGNTTTPAEVHKASRAVPEALSRYSESTILYGLMLCTAWPHATEPSSMTLPLTSAIPTLLLSGALDPTTPPANAGKVAAGLARHFNFVFPGQGHGQDFSGSQCPITITLDFLAHPTSKPAHASCVSTMKDPNWLLPGAPGSPCHVRMSASSGRFTCEDPRQDAQTTLDPRTPTASADITVHTRLTIAGNGIAGVPATITLKLSKQVLTCHSTTDGAGYAWCRVHLPPSTSRDALQVTVQFSGYAARGEAFALVQPGTASSTQGAAQVIVTDSPASLEPRTTVPSSTPLLYCVAQLPGTRAGTPVDMYFQRLPAPDKVALQSQSATGAEVEAFLVGPLQPGKWRCVVEVAGKVAGSAPFTVTP